MPQVLANPKKISSTSKAIVSTLSFFHIYNLPLTAERIWQLLYKHQADFKQVDEELENLAKQNLIVRKNFLFALADWDSYVYENNQNEIQHRWAKIKQYYWLLSSLPFVEHIAVINSMALGTADAESDIDFFVITKPKKLYFVRTLVIILFKLLGIYKSKQKINKQFCFGFYVTSDNLQIQNILLADEDPYMSFWAATLTPIYGWTAYQKFIKENQWIRLFTPNFNPEQRQELINQLKPNLFLKILFTIIMYIPSVILEPLLRGIHIRHTYKLPENHWATSSTVANAHMLKLHALDPRKELRTKYYEIIKKFEG